MPKKQIFEKYYRSHTWDECEQYYGVSKIVINRWLKIYNLNKKPKAFSCPKELTQQQRELIVGSMLGDGSISKVYINSNSYFSERHCLAQKVYLEWKASILKNFFRKYYLEGSNNSITKYNKTENWIPTHSIKMETVRHPIFTVLEQEWYLRDSNGNYITNAQNRRIKKLPDDLEITPFTLAVWYFDDGRITPTRKCCYISTDGFTENECKRLSNIITNKFNIPCNVVKTKRTNQYELHIGTKGYYKFLKLMYQYLPCQELEYKVKPMQLEEFITKRKTKRVKITFEQIKKCLELAKNNKTIKEITKQTGASFLSVGRLLKGAAYKEFIDLKEFKIIEV